MALEAIRDVSQCRSGIKVWLQVKMFEISGLFPARPAKVSAFSWPLSKRIRQIRLASGLGFQVKVFKTFQAVPFLLGGGKFT